MAFNPFKSKPPVDKPNRNAFDLSFANNVTLEFGKLYPVFCKECLPGDTFRIKPTFNFRLMPMYFPVQSRMRADLKFFYVRNRNLWTDWKKFIGQTDRISGKQVNPPYLKITPSNIERLRTGSLLDYLGVPTTAPITESTSQRFSFQGTPEYENSVYSSNPYGVFLTHISRFLSNQYGLSVFKNSLQSLSYPGSDMFSDSATQVMGVVNEKLTGPVVGQDIKIYYPADLNVNGENIFEQQYFDDRRVTGYLMVFQADQTVIVHPNQGSLVESYESGLVFRFGCGINFEGSDGMLVCRDIERGYTTIPNESLTLEEWCARIDFEQGNYYLAIALNFNNQYAIQSIPGKDKSSIYYSFPTSMDIFGIDKQTERTPDASQNPFVWNDAAAGPDISLSALPSRAYEAIYNSFYRNVEVDPFRINEQNPEQLPTLSDSPEYDKFIPVDAGGPDSYPYDFHFVNWENDFLTNSLPSPQMGGAPLVGGRPAVDYTQVNLNSSDGNVQASVYVDGSTKKLLALTPNTSNEELSEALSEAINYGISINDFRNVNALQRWLEKNVRRGYRYKDQMLSHFGVGLTYEECDMPEYIGGVSQDIQVKAISQSVETSTGPLGALAGQGGVVGTSHEIDKYTDEHGFIIGILCVIPIPTYSQLLPKHFTKFSPLDYFTPEFGHIGYQPIPMKEVAPLNVALANGNQEEVFGYQRAFYDYLASVDELHGEFREDLKDYLVDRVFQGIPHLNREFLQVNPNQINDVFNYSGGDDKIVGQIWFRCTCVRPIPKFGIPKIE